MKYLFTVLLCFGITASASASEITGTLTTGVSTGGGVTGLVITRPVASPIAGTYTTTQTVFLTGGAGTQSIHYTTDGSAATCSSGTVYSSGSPVVVTTSAVIEAISCYANGVASSVILFGYVINPPVTHSGGSGGGGKVTTPSTVANDFNHDGRVDIFDFNILMSNWGVTTGATQAMGDANGDGAVDIFDFNLLIAGWQV